MEYETRRDFCELIQHPPPPSHSHHPGRGLGLWGGGGTGQGEQSINETKLLKTEEKKNGDLVVKRYLVVFKNSLTCLLSKGRT